MTEPEQAGIVLDDNCFCCGEQNHRGLKLQFRYPEEGAARSECVIPEHFSGWKRITHGGFLAMLLDETMAHACISGGITAVTVDIQVRYVNPVEVGSTIRVRGRIARIKSRIIETEGEVREASGEVIARATARFLRM